MSSHIWRFASRYLYEFKSARVAVDKSQRAEHGGWSPPPLGMFKVNVDGATSVDGRNSSAGVVIRDSCGTVIAACCKYFQGHFSVAKAEALAVECGILLARDMKISQIIIESDAASTVSDINDKFMDGYLGNLYQGIIALLSSFSSWKIKHVKRECNRVAHELAHIARSSETNQVWFEDPPPELIELVHADCTGLFS